MRKSVIPVPTASFCCWLRMVRMRSHMTSSILLMVGARVWSTKIGVPHPKFKRFLE